MIAKRCGMAGPLRRRRPKSGNEISGLRDRPGLRFAHLGHGPHRLAVAILPKSNRQPALAADLLLALALSAIEEPDVIRSVALALALMLVAIGT